MLDKALHGIKNKEILFNDYKKLLEFAPAEIHGKIKAGWAWYYAEDKLYLLRHEFINKRGERDFEYFLEIAKSPIDAIMKI